ncbi:alpha/beta fold hydrolase [Tenacibaculum dicentrarchi]|uniref:alpha/beta fold hydrolase n=1 Tax=Tenacibaculum dicentrarchi TaxID=669041 RepID=UPI003519A527
MSNLKRIIKYCVPTIGILLLMAVLLGYSNLGNLSENENQENRFLQIGKEKIRFSQKGKGKDILLIHGTPGSIEDWKEIIDSLSQNYRVTAFDRLGHGYSSSNEYTFHLKDNAILVEKIIKKLNLITPLIVGHSYGGSIVAHMAVNSEQKDIEYIIIDSPLYSYKARKTYKLISTPILGKGIALFSSYTISENEIKKGVLFLLQSLKKEKVKELTQERQLIWSQPKVIYSKSKESMNYQKDLNTISKMYKNINSKITIITGRDTTDTFRNDCEKLHNEISNSELIILENVKHYIPLEKPLKLIDIIKKGIK